MTRKRASRKQRSSPLSSTKPTFRLTTNGLFENVTRVQRISVQDELDDIPGGIGGRDSDDDAEDDSLLPKTGRDMALSTL